MITTLFTGEICSQEDQVAELTTDNEVLVQWEHPSCSGWKNSTSHYTIHLYTNEEILSQNCSNETEYLVTNASSVTRVNITATNLCMETAVIKAYVIICKYL